MHTKSLIRIVTLAVAFAFVSAGTGSAQCENAYRPQPPHWSEIMRLVYNQVFGQPVFDNAIKYDYKLFLRYMPQDGSAESEILLSKLRDSEQFEVTFTELEGNRSVSDRIANVESLEDAESLAAKLSTKRTVVALPNSTAAKLLNTFSKLSLNPTLETGFFESGWKYDLFYETASQAIEIRLHSNPPNKPNPKLVMWMNQVREVVLSQLNRQRDSKTTR